MKKERMMIKKVLVIRFRQVGDSVLSVVLCRTIRKNFPDAEIHYVLNDHIAPLFSGHPDVDRVIVFSHRENHHFFTYLCKVRQLMKSEKYDVIVDTRSTIKTLWFSLFSLSTKYRIARKKRYNVFFMNRRVDCLWGDDDDEIVRTLTLLKPLEQVKSLEYVSDLKLDISAHEIEDFKVYMEGQGIDFERPVVVCVPFTRIARKAWDVGKMQEVLFRMIRQYDVQLIFNYAREEKADALNLYKEMGEDEHIFIGVEADSLRKLVAMLTLSDFFFGNEGGARHIAQACEVSGLAIYPPWVDKRKWLPSKDVRYQGISSLDFLSEQERVSLSEQEIFDRLSVEQVWERLVAMLNVYVGRVS